MPEPPAASETIPGSTIRSDGATVAALREALAAGTLTARGLTGFYLGRIERLDPVLHSVISVNGDVLAEAEASDRATGQRDGAGGPGCARPLQGIPVLVKDNIAVRGMPATAGSPALAGAEQGDAWLVTRLREAGAVILGKANLSEWANFRSPHSTSGWSTLGGQAANPHALDRNPSGSSSGSAVAVAAGPGPGRRRDRDRRQHRLPGQRLRDRRSQAHARPGQPRRDRAGLGSPGHRWPDGAQRGGRRRAPVRDGRRRPG